MCCGRKCCTRLKPTELDLHLIDLHFYKCKSYVDFWTWVRGLCFVITPLNKNGNGFVKAHRIGVYRLPAITYNLCKKVFCCLLGISERTLELQMNKSYAGALAPDHGNGNRVAHNAASQGQKDAVVEFLLDVAHREGIPNPRFTFNDREGARDEASDLIHLPPHYSKQALQVFVSPIRFFPSS